MGRKTHFTNMKSRTGVPPVPKSCGVHGQTRPLTYFVSVKRHNAQAHWACSLTGPQSRRDCVLQPRVASLRATLGVCSRMVANPERVVARCALSGRNPFRVVDSSKLLPRVVRSSQPWALGQNPFGIRSRCRLSILSGFSTQSVAAARRPYPSILPVGIPSIFP
jgi:hypothetical protein